MSYFKDKNRDSSKWKDLIEESKKFIGVATQHHEDTFDYTKGMTLARVRAMKNILKNGIRFINTDVNVKSLHRLNILYKFKEVRYEYIGR